MKVEFSISNLTLVVIKVSKGHIQPVHAMLLSIQCTCGWVQMLYLMILMPAILNSVSRLSVESHY